VVGIKLQDGGRYHIEEIFDFYIPAIRRPGFFSVFGQWIHTPLVIIENG
jgi:hypothetical protein